MPTISKLYDIKSLIEWKAGVKIAGHTNVRGVEEYHSGCPWCGGTDRFVMRPTQGDYSCAIRSSGCGRHGDCIDFLVDYCNMPRSEAMSTLGLEDVSFYSPENDNKASSISRDQSPAPKWQEAATLITERAERYLWHPNSAKGKQALDYLHSRGLKDETIKKFHLGYVPLMADGSWYSGSFDDWGLNAADYPNKEAVKVPNGILIPWFVGGKPYKLALRRPGEQMSKGQVIGSVDCLYNVDSLQCGEICMMVEGEIDCMSVAQEASDLLNCVATGSTSKGRTDRCIAELTLASFILQSFDNDNAGDVAANVFWLQRFDPPKKIERWATMFWNDPNELLQAQLKGETGGVGGLTLREWVKCGVDLAHHDLALQSGLSTPAREVLQAVEDHFDIDEEAILDAANW